ncbi:5328_t:CDS:2 [Funneliformis geosporum]|uniref:5328_t:CDS:1 n=1 Tax=Funneliformis geosporum TaxID=1117311 RepID=A0A9W4SQP9_9GLOM|nr:5328_t:CDS:2 [Funneliformis geosporum]
MLLRDEYKNNLDKVVKIYSPILNKLAELGGRFATKVALKTRELLIHCHLSSYEEKLIDTRFAVFDVLPNFLYHQDNWVGLAALEVYARRPYRAYQLINIKYQAPFMVSLNFSLHNATTDSPTGSVESPSFFSMRCSANRKKYTTNLKLFPKIQTVQGWKSQDPSDRYNINNVLNFDLRLEDDAIEDEALKKQLKPPYTTTFL